MRFDLCVADCTGDKTNVHYPNHAEINNAGELAAAIAKDNTCGQFKSYYRSNDNFIKCNCIVMDCDNDHTENPDEMIYKTLFFTAVQKNVGTEYEQVEIIK